MQCEHFQNLCNVLEIRERSLRSVRDEMDLLNMCGGLFPEDVARLRSSIVGNVGPSGDQVNAVPVIVVKAEPVEPVVPVVKLHHNQPTMSLKSMLQSMLPTPVSDSQMTQLCKRMKRRMTTLYTFQKHKATFVMTQDWLQVRAALEKELAETVWRQERRERRGAGVVVESDDAIEVD